MAVTNSERSNIHHMIPLDIQIEVFSRLPVKSLMRFKCVCKHLFSLIIHPSFVDLYQSRRGVFLVIPPRNGRTYPYEWDRRFYVIDCKKNPKDRAAVLEDPSLPFTTNRVTNIVNGLICFYHENGNEGSISIYNLATRENLPLPAPTCLSYIQRKCYLGYDPINKEYKLLHTYWQKKTPRVGIGCEVFNITGKHKTWRTIDISGNIDIIAGIYSYDVGFCHEGVIYWRRKGIIAFYVEREKFEHINNPPGEMPEGEISVCQVGGYLSLVVTPRTPFRYGRAPYIVEIVVTMWRLMGRDQDDGKPLSSKEVITCPFENRVEGQVKCTDFGLVSLGTVSPESDLVIIDCYDLKAGKHKVLRVNNAQGFFTPTYSYDLSPLYGFEATLLVENIMPLKSNNIQGRSVIGL